MTYCPVLAACSRASIRKKTHMEWPDDQYSNPGVVILITETFSTKKRRNQILKKQYLCEYCTDSYDIGNLEILKKQFEYDK